MGFGLIRIDGRVVVNALRTGNKFHSEIVQGLPDDARLLNGSCNQYVSEVELGVMSTRYGGSPAKPSQVDIVVRDIGPVIYDFPTPKLDPKVFINELTPEERDEVYRYLHIVWKCRM